MDSIISHTDIHGMHYNTMYNIFSDLYQIQNGRLSKMSINISGIIGGWTGTWTGTRMDKTNMF